MTRSVRLLALAFGMLALAQPAAAQSASANEKAKANVKVMKPLQLTSLRDLVFGTVLVGTFTGSDTVTISPIGRTCGTGGGLTCSGTFSTAQYRVNGSSNQVVLISSVTPTVTLSNGTGATLSMTPTFPSSITLANSGATGTLFEVGGSLSFNSAMADGVYTGTIDIQVAYQ